MLPFKPRAYAPQSSDVQHQHHEQEILAGGESSTPTALMAAGQPGPSAQGFSLKKEVTNMFGDK
jgi:hypothetical protein